MVEMAFSMDYGKMMRKAKRIGHRAQADGVGRRA